MSEISAEKAAINYLERVGGRASVSDVINAVLRVKRYSGKTPRNTISAKLHKSKRIKKKDGYCELIRS